MTKFLPILAALILIPVLSQAKIGEKKADYEAAHGKPVKYATLVQESEHTQWSVMKDWDMYESDFYPPAVQSERPVLKYVGVSYSLGKVAAEFYPGAGKDETVMRALQASLGTSDLEERNDLNPLLKLWGFQSYATKDGKFAADLMPLGTIVGTKGAIEKFESQVLQTTLQDMGKGSEE
jgi:hypothetical protein